MKLNTFLWLFWMAVCLPCAAFCQSTIIKVNPLGLPLATINASVEQKIAPGISLQLGAFYTGFRFKDSHYKGCALTPELRIYFGENKNAMQGWYLAPFARYSQMRLSEVATDDNPQQLEGNARFVGGGALVGHQWLMGEHKRISVDVFAGPKYSKILSVEGTASEKDYKADFITGGGFWIRSGITIGLAF